jgi:integrase
MQANAIEHNQAGTQPGNNGEVSTPYAINAINAKTQPRQFRKVFDGCKRRVRGLWQATASGNYYAQLTVEDEEQPDKLRIRKVRLVDEDGNPVRTVSQAVKAMARLKAKREDGSMPVLKRSPRFSDFVKTYLDWIKAGEGQKAQSTIEKEDGQLERWKGHFGTCRLDQIRPTHVNKYVQKRLEAGMSPRTTKLDVIALRNVLNHAIDEGWIKVLPLPRSRRKKIKLGGVVESKRDLFDPRDLDALCEAALAKKEDGEPVTKNGQQLCDYLRFMAYSGTRRNEALGAQWSDVDFDGALLHVRRQITHRGVELPKNGTTRMVDFNPKLEALLRDMHGRRAPDTDWVFPSPQRGEKDIPAKSFRESFDMAKAHALKDHPKLAGKGFHALRHYYISYCVMSGLDYLTIAEWVGHQDGGVLIGKVYGHLNDEHKKAAAQRVNFGPVLVPMVPENAVAKPAVSA